MYIFEKVNICFVCNNSRKLIGHCLKTSITCTRKVCTPPQAARFIPFSGHHFLRFPHLFSTILILYLCIGVILWRFLLQFTTVFTPYIRVKIKFALCCVRLFSVLFPWIRSFGFVVFECFFIFFCSLDLRYLLSL